MSKTKGHGGQPRFTCECGGTYKLTTKTLGGMPYELYECPKCRDSIFTMAQTRAYRQIHELVEAAKRLETLRLRRVGNSVNATVPKELAELGFGNGQPFRWEIQSPTQITLHLVNRASAARRPSKSKAKPRRNGTRSGVRKASTGKRMPVRSTMRRTPRPKTKKR